MQKNSGFVILGEQSKDPYNHFKAGVCGISSERQAPRL